MANPPDPLTLQWHADPETDLAADLATLGDRYEVAFGPVRSHDSSYLDTADWRLRSKGAILRHEHDDTAGALVLTTGSGELRSELGPALVWPALVDALPEGPLRDGVAGPMWIRAIAPVFECRTQQQEVTVHNGDGKIVVRLDVTRAEGVAPATRAFARLVVRPVLGYGTDGARVGKALLKLDRFDRASESLYDALLADAGLPIVASAPTFTVDTPADMAVANALAGFADAITATVDGVIADHDSEFLHDMRVAVRRTRSMLKLVGDVLPFDISRYESDFRLLGDVTTPTRDLDVYLLELPELAQWLTVGEPRDLDAFRDHLTATRDAERRKLVRALESKRFAQLFADWRADLTAVTTAEASRGDARTTAGDLVTQRIKRVYKKVVKIARAITPESESEDVHSLRKRCKELRYLLEFGAPVCDTETHRAAIKDLKSLQDILGDFQDGEMQSHGLRRFAEEMLAAQAPPAATLLAMGELSARFGRQQREARGALTDQLERYLGTKAHQRIEAMLP
ncbi:CHAD domain-containing protein [Antrihabitans sp. YC2-6]|uniref:CYTH and CHAD domain-containing protein n=1 Tax=Antrihabitans sp. YC2-6 TaxID=2799498 RepID=UPI0018F5588C|nr:CHAD domain-containing protein [Antrihabitans sp. YC2-6]MBJ8344888.1 CHAD domain-containing protein [Antrihabitans sp. YC2-6]